MANVKRCDRCGWCYDKVENDTSILTIQIFGRGAKGNGSVDLCVECTEKLMKWLNEFKKKEENHD